MAQAPGCWLPAAERLSFAGICVHATALFSTASNPLLPPSPVHVLQGARIFELHPHGRYNRR